MAVVDSDVTPARRARQELIETIARTNITDTVTVNRALAVPSWALAVTFLLDVTVTGTTPTMTFEIFGAQSTTGRYGALLDSTTDKWPFASTGAAPLSAAITTITTGNSTPIAAVSIGPGLTLDVTGSATANAHYSFPGYLPTWLIYTYVLTEADTTEDFNGTISAIWEPRR